MGRKTTQRTICPKQYFCCEETACQKNIGSSGTPLLKESCLQGVHMNLQAKQHSRQAGIPGITPQQVEAQPWLDELNQDVVIPLDGAEAILTETCGLGQNLCWLARFLAGTFLGWPDFWWLIHVCTHTYICMYVQLCTYVCTFCRHEHVTKVTICPHSVDRSFEDKEVHGDSMTANKSMCMCFPWWMCSSMQITPVQ